MSSPESSKDLQESINELTSLIRDHQLGSDPLAALGETAAAADVFGYLNHLNPDVSADVFIRLIVWLMNSEDQIRNPEALLRVMVKRASIDQVRRRDREIPVTTSTFELLTKSDAEFSDHIIAREQVRHAIRSAAAQGEPAIAECATVWLDMADEFGRSPTSREVADRLDVSHQTVINRLRTLERFLDP